MPGLGEHLAHGDDRERPGEYHEIGFVTQVATASLPTLVQIGTSPPAPVTNVCRGYVPVVGDSVLVLVIGATRVIVNGFAPVDPRWHVVGAAGEPAFLNSWGNWGPSYAGLRYRRVGDVVSIRGLIVKAAAAGANSIVFQIPVGFRPVEHYLWITGMNAGNQYGRIDVHNNGNVVVEGGHAAGGYVSYNVDFPTT
jgi:hypothetical protein